MSLQLAPKLLYLDRADWGADTSKPRLGYAVAPEKRTEAVMHHTVIVDDDTTKNIWESLAEVKGKMRQLQVIRPDLGPDVPYNDVGFLMSDGGVIICEGRGRDRTGAHTYGHNTPAIALSMQGNFSLPWIGVSMWLPSVSRYWAWRKSELPNLGSKRPVRALVYGHRDFDSTSCPGDELYAQLPNITFAQEDEMPVTNDEVAQAVQEILATPVDKYVGFKRAIKGLATEVVNQHTNEVPHGGTGVGISNHSHAVRIPEQVIGTEAQ